MNDAIERELRETIEAFAVDVTAILQRAVADAVASALGATRKVARSSPREPTARNRGGRRTRAQVEREADALLKEVTRKGGRRIEEIARSMKVSTKSLTLPMRALLKKRRVKRKGVARGTTYTAS